MIYTNLLIKAAAFCLLSTCEFVMVNMLASTQIWDDMFLATWQISSPVSLFMEDTIWHATAGKAQVMDEFSLAVSDSWSVWPHSVKQLKKNRITIQYLTEKFGFRLVCIH